MAITFLDPGLDATDGFQLYTSTGVAGTSTVAQDQTTKHTGRGAIKFTIDGSGSDVFVKAASVLADAGRRVSMWVYFTAFPATGTPIFSATTSASTNLWTLQVSSTGVLRFYQSSSQSTPIGAASTVTLALNTWYRIAVSWTVTSTTVNSIKCWVNGDSTPVITITNGTLATTVGVNLLLGTSFTGVAQAGATWYVDDLYIDDSTAVTDPGNICVTAKLPAANNVNTYGTAVGANPVNRWTNVNERPLSITNGWSSAATSQTETYGIEAQAAGDVNLTGATIVGYGGWMWAKLSGTVGGTVITLNGVDTTVTLTTTAAAYFAAYVTSATYPANAAGIGQKRTTGTGTATLYECGVLIAYNPTVMPAALVAGQAVARASLW